MIRHALLVIFALLATGSAHGATDLPPASFGGNPQYTVKSLTTDGVATFTLTLGSGGSNITATFDASGVNTSTSVITTNGPHGLTAGNLVTFSRPGPGTLPAPLLTTQRYTVNVLSPTQIQLYVPGAWRHAVNGFRDFVRLTTQGTGAGSLITDATYREYLDVRLTGSGSCTGAVANVYTQSSSIKGLYITNPGHGCATSDTFKVPTLPAPDNGLTGGGGTVTQVGLATSRTSARTPFVVQVSAKGIWATSPAGNGTIPFNGYEDLEYSWNFGDPNGTETFTRPTDGATVNANTDQIGPQAMYVYRRPGTFTITVTARGWNGSQFITATKTQTVTATQTTPGKEVWFNPGCTGAPRPGCPGGPGAGTRDAPYTSASPSSQLLSTMIGMPANKANWVIHFARGSAFTGSTVGLVSHLTTITGMRLDDCDDYTCAAKYQPNGPGAKPAFNISNNTPLQFTVFSNQGGAFNDITISNIAFNGTGPNGALINSSFAVNTFGYLDGVDISATGAAPGTYTDVLTGSGARIGFGLYKVTVTGDAAVEPAGGPAQLVSLACSVWYGVMGNVISGGGQAANSGAMHGYYTFDTPFIPRDQVYYAWNTNGPLPGRVYFIKARLSHGGGGIVFSQNSTSNVIVSIENAAEVDDQIYSDANAVVDGNAHFSTGNANAGELYNGPTQQRTVTIRNNRTWGRASIFNPPHNTPNNVTTSYKIYKNKAYTNVSAQLGNFNYLTPCGEAPPIFNCGPWTAPQQFTDNQFRQAAASVPVAMSLGFNQFRSMGTSQFTRNQYYASSTGPVTNVFQNTDNGVGAVFVNFATWKSSTGLDAGSTFDNTGAIPTGWTTATPSRWSDFGP